LEELSGKFHTVQKCCSEPKDGDQKNSSEMQLFTTQHKFIPQKTHNFNKTVRTSNLATILSPSRKEIMCSNVTKYMLW
jgi:hypothetical protein